MSTSTERRRQRLLASGVYVQDGFYPYCVWYTRPEFVVGDLVTHSDGYGSRIGTITHVYDLSFENEAAPDGWCHHYDYRVEWPPDPRFEGHYAKRPYSRRTTGCNLILVSDARAIVEREGEKRGWKLANDWDERYVELHMEHAPRD